MVQEHALPFGAGSRVKCQLTMWLLCVWCMHVSMWVFMLVLSEAGSGVQAVGGEEDAGVFLILYPFALTQGFSVNYKLPALLSWLTT